MLDSAQLKNLLLILILIWILRLLIALLWVRLCLDTNFGLILLVLWVLFLLFLFLIENDYLRFFNLLGKGSLFGLVFSLRLLF